MTITYRESNKAEVEIKYITLLTTLEAERIPENILQYEEYWWLRSHGNYYDCDCVAYVHGNGHINYHGDVPDWCELAVRPVLKIRDLESLNLEVGDMLMIQGKKYVYIGNNKALYNDEVVYSKFDEMSNDYEDSKIKETVDRWFKEE